MRRTSHLLTRQTKAESVLVRTRPGVGAFRLVRHAVDFIISLESRRDGERVLAGLGACLAKHGLTFNPTMTRHADFRPKAGGHGSSNRFDFLGFTHLRGKSRIGCWVMVRRFAARERHPRAIKPVWNWCKEHRRMPLEDQCRDLAGVVRGHCAHCGLPGNGSPVSGTPWPEAGHAGSEGIAAAGGSAGTGSKPSSLDTPCQRPRSRGQSMPLERTRHARNRVRQSLTPGSVGDGAPQRPQPTRTPFFTHSNIC